MAEKIDLSILIPARNEMFLAQTVIDILKHKEANTEVLVGLDGEWADPVLPVNESVHILYYPEAIGQRAMTNQLAKLARGKYVMKVDAHCAFDQGFDRKMLEGFARMGDDVTFVPVMRNLWAFNWKCMQCGKKTYQGPEPTSCADCSNTTNFTRKLKWKAKRNPQSTSYCFDSEPHFQYFNEYKKFQVGDIVETMSLQGSCFMTTAERYWRLNLCDESFGSWGSQGIEVACKTWLSGGRCLVNKNTWYAHMFRTKGGFSFPYPQSGKQVQGAKKLAKKLFYEQKYEHAIHPLSWLIEKFSPVKGWTEQDLQQLKQTEKNTINNLQT